MRFFELCLSNGYSICIKGYDEPTVSEAEDFLTDEDKRGETVTDVLEMDEEYARDSFDFSNFDNWPIFRKPVNSGDLFEVIVSRTGSVTVRANSAEEAENLVKNNPAACILWDDDWWVTDSYKHEE